MENAIIVLQLVRCEGKSRFLHSVLHEKTLEIRAVNGVLAIPDFLDGIALKASATYLPAQHFAP
ncbi:MAG: hypothetical protein IJY96_04175 [Oscillospiraceae bacterium]|nr:hypothetical protein [Oscillospiraceae bacterium]